METREFIVFVLGRKGNGSSIMQRKKENRNQQAHPSGWPQGPSHKKVAVEKIIHIFFVDPTSNMVHLM